MVGVKEARYSKYYALVTEEECLLQEMDTILDKLFYKSPKRLMATLVQHEDFSKDDLNEIKNLIAALEEKTDD